MLKLPTIFVFFSLLLCLTAKGSLADYSILADKEAKTIEVKNDERTLKLRTFFKSQGSILENEAEKFVSLADKYGIRYSLLPAISGRESGFAKYYPYGSYNSYGWGPTMRFQSWGDGINKILYGIKTNYIQKWGRTTVNEIAPLYAESRTWASGVNRFITQIENTPVQSPESDKLSLNL